MNPLNLINKLKTLEKKAKCPRCGEITTLQGHPGEKIILTCPKCNTKGYFIMPKIEKKKILLKRILPALTPLIPITTSVFLFPENEPIIFISFIALTPVFILLKHDGKIPVAYAIFTFLTSMSTLSFYKNETLANQLVIYTYWLLAVGVLCLSTKFLRKLKILDTIKNSG